MTDLGLTPAQLQAVRSTWAVVEKDLKGHGVNVFIAIFEKYPDAQKLFKRMKDTPLSELKTAPTLKAHALGFMKELSGFVSNLECADEVVVGLEANARRHYRRGVTVQHYKLVLELYHEYLAKQLGSAFTEDASKGWSLVAGAIVATVEKEYKAIEAEK